MVSISANAETKIIIAFVLERTKKAGPENSHDPVFSIKARCKYAASNWGLCKKAESFVFMARGDEKVRHITMKSIFYDKDHIHCHFQLISSRFKFPLWQ